MPTLSLPVPDSTIPSGSIVTKDGRTLPLRTTLLQVHAAGGVARVRLVQTFANPWTEPLHVTYRLPLPADAAIGGFLFRLGAQVVTGEIERRAAARERFEQAIATGRTAALLEQDRSAVFTQELGNLPAGAELEASLDIDQPLQWLDDGWQWRFPTTVAPRYLGGVGRIADADRQQVDVLDPAAPVPPARLELDLVVADPLSHGAHPTSSSHALNLATVAGGMRIAFDAEGARVAMDRDVVVRWPAAAPSVGVHLRSGRGHRPATATQAFGLLTLAPPSIDAHARCLSRDLIVLLDISGSMRGAPIAQAKQVTLALVRSLTASDRLELHAFASRPLAWRNGPQPATPANQADAARWLDALHADGSTEMHEAIVRALTSLRADAQRQVVVITDGLIGFESEVVGAIRRGLPAGSRVHVVGVGSAPNRTLTLGASRAGHGCEILLGVDDPIDPAVTRLLARTTAPIVDGLTVTGSALVAVAPQALPDLFAGAPARIAVQLRAEGGTLRVHGRTATGAFTHDLVVAPVPVDAESPQLARGFAREAAEDLEAELAATGDARSIDPRLERLGLDHAIATRLTSWIAMTEATTVDPRGATRREVVPQELPHGMSIEALGLRACAMPMAASPAILADTTMCALPRARTSPRAEEERHAYGPPPKPPARAKGGFMRRLFGPGTPKDGGRAALLARLRLRTPNAWVFELHGLASWSLPTSVVVVFADGSRAELALVAENTTAAGAVVAGAVIRLALRPIGSTPSARVASLRIVLATGTLDLPVA